jgi:hypothetical protein
MLRHRATSRVKGRSGRTRGPDVALKHTEYEDDDYPIDCLAPDDLPVRDITEHQEEWHTEGRAKTKALGKATSGSADVAPTGCVDNPSEIAPSTQGTLRDHEPASETPSPESHVEEAGATELPTQYLLPGLEPDDASGPNHTRKRQTRPRRARMSSNNSALRAAQMELWLDTTDASRPRRSLTRVRIGPPQPD